MSQELPILSRRLTDNISTKVLLTVLFGVRSSMRQTNLNCIVTCERLFLVRLKAYDFTQSQDGVNGHVCDQVAAKGYCPDRTGLHASVG